VFNWVAGFIPAPILFGRLIDSSCRLWQRTAANTPKSSCDKSLSDAVFGGTGSCLLYDTAKFRQRTYGVVFGFQIIDLILVVVLYRLILNRKFEGAIDGDVEENNERPESTLNGNVTKSSIIEVAQQQQQQRDQSVDSEVKPEDRETIV